MPDNNTGPTEPVRMAPPPLFASMSPPGAFIAIARTCLAQLVANGAGALASEDPEFIHQMRVALRRLRSALRMFKPCLTAEFFETTRSDLQWLGAMLGDVRDWDVLVEDTLPRVFGPLPHRSGPLEKSLRSLIAARRDEARAAVRKALRGRRYRELERDWNQALAGLASQLAQHGGLDAYAADVLRAAAKKLLGATGRLADMSPAKRHRFRIHTKRLRYAVEFFSPLFPQKRARKYAAVLADLQEALGIANDNAVALSRIASLPVTTVAFGIVQRSLEHSSAEALESAAAATSRLRKTKPFWAGTKSRKTG